MPVGELVVHSGEPLDTAAAEDTRDLVELAAPEGATLVPITWQYDQLSKGRFDAYLGTGATPVVTLVTEGSEQRLPTPDQDADAESFYVVVDGDADERRLEVEFDGVTQTVDLRTGKRKVGAAAPLYDVPAGGLRHRSCDDDQVFGAGVLAQFTCDVDGPALLPYAGGVWAPKGKSWLVVSVTTRLRGYSVATGPAGAANYVADSLKGSVWLDGRAPAQVTGGGEADRCPGDVGTCGFSKHLVFQVDDDDRRLGKLRIRQTYRLSLLGRWGAGEDPGDRITRTAEKELALGTRKALRRR
ncbi:hypothetical protein [Nocardioides sp. TF02-7]|uniref:hypothetical protein n=1 Tax=Nocardioides sp. TF02-7 TaxID=2917724 RepID=UPI001F0608AE|nr:hypothetical protein [Nocardioides sp. TF02-7]UMG91010.1 hypothetical protein MF408_12290 [Nocardioides sp. TF02-7]